MGKGGGSAPAQPTTQTVQQSNIPEYARPYFEDIMQRGQAVSQVQYQPYTEERVASFSPLQQQAFQGIQGLGPSPLLTPAASMTDAAGLGGLGAGQQFQQAATSPGAMASYMSPYMQNVVDWQKTQAIQDYARQLPGQQAAATRAGAFGGSRQAIVEAEAQRNLQNQLAGIQAQGTQTAFDQASKNLQFGSQLGLQGLGLAGQMGAQFGQLGQTAFGQQAAAAQAQQQAGAIQQAQEQQKKDLGYEEFMRQQLYPQSQLQFLSSLLRGSVVAPQQTMYSYQQQPSMASQLGGLGLGALGLSKAFGAKDGGEVPGYAEGGITGGGDKMQGVTPSRVTNVKKQLLSGVDPRQIPDSLGVMLALQDREFVKQLQLTSAAKNQQALDGGRQQQPSVYDEKMVEAAGLAGMDAGVMEDVYAGGGIVAFQEGGDTRSELTQEERDRLALLGIGKRFGAAGRRLGAAALDVGSLVPRGIAGALNTAIRLPRAMGVDVPFIPVDTSSMTPNYDRLRAAEAGLPAALPRQAAPATPDTIAAQNQREINRLPPPAPRVQPRLEAPPARAAATAAPAVKPEEPKTSPYTPIGLLDVDAEGKRVFDALSTAAPSELKETLADINTRIEQAKKDKNQGLWLALAHAGFEAMSGTSPYAAVNFGKGFMGGTKQAQEVVKLYQERNDALKKAEREERRLDRAERLGNTKMRLAAEQRAQDHNLKANEFNEKIKAEWEKIATERMGIKSRERVGMAQVAATRAGREQQAADTRDANIRLREASIRQAIDKHPMMQAYDEDLRTMYASLRKPGLGRTDAAKIQTQIQQLENERSRYYNAAVERALGRQGGAGVDMSAIDAELARRGVK